jgi:DNA replication protein DnaC
LLTHPTLDQLQQLGLAGMARAFLELEANPSQAELSHAEWLGLLLDRETTERHDRRLRARLRYARLRHQAVVEDIDYRAARGLDRAHFQSLAAGRWIEAAQNLIIEGPTEPDSYCPSRYLLRFQSHFGADRQTAAAAGGADLQVA